MKTLKNFSPREAYAAYVLGSVLVDVRDDKPADAKTADVKRMVTLPFSELDQRFGELPANRPVVLLSRIGIKGKQAAKFLLEKGYQDVATVDGGLTSRLGKKKACPCAVSTKALPLQKILFFKRPSSARAFFVCPRVG
jgi:rhodanese-related sulfurtransferase